MDHLAPQLPRWAHLPGSISEKPYARAAPPPAPDSGLLPQSPEGEEATAVRTSTGLSLSPRSRAAWGQREHLSSLWPLGIWGPRERGRGEEQDSQALIQPPPAHVLAAEGKVPRVHGELSCYRPQPSEVHRRHPASGDVAQPPLSAPFPRVAVKGSEAGAGRTQNHASVAGRQSQCTGAAPSRGWVLPRRFSCASPPEGRIAGGSAHLRPPLIPHPTGHPRPAPVRSCCLPHQLGARP